MAVGKNKGTSVERTSDRELTVTRTFNGPVHLVFQAWSTPALFQRWWVPQSFGMTMLSCDMDVRTGGAYRIVMKHPAMEQPMAFFGKYRDVVSNARIVWTNEEGGAEPTITTVTFEERGAQTLVVLRDLYPSKEALDAALADQSTDGFPEQFEQLDVLLAA